MEDLYKAQHNGSLDGLDQILAKAKAESGSELINENCGFRFSSETREMPRQMLPLNTSSRPKLHW